MNDLLIISQLALIVVGIIIFSIGIAPLLNMTVLRDGSEEFRKCRKRAFAGAFLIGGGIAVFLITAILFR